MASLVRERLFISVVRGEEKHAQHLLIPQTHGERNVISFSYLSIVFKLWDMKFTFFIVCTKAGSVLHPNWQQEFGTHLYQATFPQ